MGNTDTVKINNKRASLVWLPQLKGFEPQRLLPKVNIISADYWAQVKGHGMVAHLLKHDVLEVVTSGSPLIANDSKETLKSMNAPDAINLVKSCPDVAQLLTWTNTEGRKKVVEALSTRIAELEAMQKAAEKAKASGADS